MLPDPTQLTHIIFTLHHSYISNFSLSSGVYNFKLLEQYASCRSGKCIKYKLQESFQSTGPGLSICSMASMASICRSWHQIPPIDPIGLLYLSCLLCPLILSPNTARSLLPIKSPPSHIQSETRGKGRPSAVSNDTDRISPSLEVWSEKWPTEGQSLRLSPSPSSERKVRSISISNPEQYSSAAMTADFEALNHEAATGKHESADPSHNSNVKGSPSSWSKDRKRASSTVEVVKASRTSSQIKRKYQDPVLLQARLQLTKTGRVTDSSPRLPGRGLEMKGEQAAKRTLRDSAFTAVERDSQKTEPVQLTSPTNKTAPFSSVRMSRLQPPTTRTQRTWISCSNADSAQAARQGLRQAKALATVSPSLAHKNTKGESTSHLNSAGPVVGYGGPVGPQGPCRQHPDLLGHAHGEAKSRWESPGKEPVKVPQCNTKL